MFTPADFLATHRQSGRSHTTYDSKGKKWHIALKIGTVIKMKITTEFLDGGIQLITLENVNMSDESRDEVTLSIFFSGLTHGFSSNGWIINIQHIDPTSSKFQWVLFEIHKRIDYDKGKLIILANSPDKTIFQNIKWPESAPIELTLESAIAHLRD